MGKIETYQQYKSERRRESVEKKDNSISKLGHMYKSKQREKRNQN